MAASMPEKCFTGNDPIFCFFFMNLTFSLGLGLTGLIMDQHFMCQHDQHFKWLLANRITILLTLPQEVFTGLEINYTLFKLGFSSD